MKKLNLERQMRKKKSMQPKRMPRKIQPIETRLHLGDELDSQDLAVRNLKFAPERKLRMKQGLLRSKKRQIRPVVRSDALMDRMSLRMGHRDKRALMSKTLKKDRHDVRPIAVRIQKGFMGMRDPLSEMDLRRSKQVIKPVSVKVKGMGDPFGRFQKRRSSGRKLLQDRMDRRILARDQMSIDNKQATLAERMAS